MRYEGVVYRPPSEADSLLIQATVGCPHNRCTFCGMYKDKRFRIRRVSEIREDLLAARSAYGAGVGSLFLPDGNSILMKTAQLVEIISFARTLFPDLKRVTMYGSARFVVKKTVEELKKLRRAGLTRLHTGMESGDDETLRRLCKGTTGEEIVRAGIMVKEAGIEQSEYFLVGVAGSERSREHALRSAEVLSAVDPEFIRLRTYVPRIGTPLGDAWKAGEFRLLSPREALREIGLLLERVTGTGMVLSDHISNYANVSGRLPGDREDMLVGIRRALERPENEFRPPIIS